jgi:hypothetical protein
MRLFPRSCVFSVGYGIARGPSGLGVLLFSFFYNFWGGRGVVV